jgi:hypothetical protein
MTTRHATTSPPTPGALRFGRGRTPDHGKCVFIRHHNLGNANKVAARKPALRSHEYVGTSNSLRHNGPTCSQTNLPHRVAWILFP